MFLKHIASPLDSEFQFPTFPLPKFLTLEYSFCADCANTTEFIKEIGHSIVPDNHGLGYCLNIL